MKQVNDGKHGVRLAWRMFLVTGMSYRVTYTESLGTVVMSPKEYNNHVTH